VVVVAVGENTNDSMEVNNASRQQIVIHVLQRLFFVRVLRHHGPLEVVHEHARLRAT